MARKITRRLAVGLLTSVPLGAAAWPLASRMQAGDARRPNIIYIMSDRTNPRDRLGNSRIPGRNARDQQIEFGSYVACPP